VQISNDISIGSAVFAQLTAERPYTMQWAALPPQNCPFHGGSEPNLIHDSLGPSEPITETAFRSVQPFFAQLTAECPYTLQWAAPLKIAPSYGDLDSYLIHGSLDPPESST